MDKNSSLLIKAKKAKKLIFAGDTHGDLQVSRQIIKEYLKPGSILVFLGDYVDRGPASKENLEFLLEKKKHFPKQLILLMGNHEGYPIHRFYPADFWENLSVKEEQKYRKILTKLPLAFSFGPIIALHGAPPQLESLDEINQIRPDDNSWRQICWGDLSEEKGWYLGSFHGRPKFGRNYFYQVMDKLDKKILVRAHHPSCPTYMLDDRCLTLFTSSVYDKKRIIAIFDTSQKIKTARGLKIIEI